MGRNSLQLGNKHTNMCLGTNTSNSLVSYKNDSLNSLATHVENTSYDKCGHGNYVRYDANYCGRGYDVGCLYDHDRHEAVANETFVYTPVKVNK